MPARQMATAQEVRLVPAAVPQAVPAWLTRQRPMQIGVQRQMGPARPLAVQTDRRPRQEAEPPAVGQTPPARQGAVGKLLPAAAPLPALKLPGQPVKGTGRAAAQAEEAVTGQDPDGAPVTPAAPTEVTPPRPLLRQDRIVPAASSAGLAPSYLVCEHVI